MKNVKERRKERILNDKIDPKTIDDEDEEDKLIKDFIRKNKIESKMFKNSKFWQFLDLIFSKTIVIFDLYYSFSEETKKLSKDNLNLGLDHIYYQEDDEVVVEPLSPSIKPQDGLLKRQNSFDVEFNWGETSKVETLEDLSYPQLASRVFVYFAKYCYRDISKPELRIEAARVDYESKNSKKEGYKVKGSEQSRKLSEKKEKLLKKIQTPDVHKFMAYFSDLDVDEFTYPTDDDNSLIIKKLDRSSLLDDSKPSQFSYFF